MLSWFFKSQSMLQYANVKAPAKVMIKFIILRSTLYCAFLNVCFDVAFITVCPFYMGKLPWESFSP